MNKQKEMTNWLNTLLDYAKGLRKWDTGGVWVCESHPCTPFEEGTSFDCTCGGPGMPPYIPLTEGDKPEPSTWENMIFPCCKKELPAPLDGVELATCPCGQSYKPSVIIEYNEMIDIITGWRDVVNGKAFIKAEPGEGPFIASLVGRGIQYAR